MKMQIEHDEFQRLKRLSLVSILRFYGYTPKPNGGLTSLNPNAWMMLCPFHEDKHPSFSVSKKGDVDLWHCFACNIGGTVIDFVMKKENLTLPETFKLLRERFVGQTGLSHSKDRKEASPLHNGKGLTALTLQRAASLTPSGSPHHGAYPALNRLELLKNVSDFYHKTFFEDQRGMEYLRARGLKSEEIYRSFKIGFVNGSLRKTLSYSNPLMKELKDLGILNEEGNERFYLSVVIPLLDEDGNVVGLYGRSTKEKRHLFTRGPHQGLVNRQGALDTKKVILTESILDALSLYELGIRNVIPCYGTRVFTPDHEKLLRKQEIQELEICFDNDDPGLKGAKALAEKLSGVRSSLVKLPVGIKDPNDFLLACKPKADFEKLPRLPLTPTPSLGGCKEDASAAKGSDEAYEITKDNRALHLEKQGRHYRVFLPEFDSIYCLRVNLRLFVGEEDHVDVFDLYNERHRERFARKASQKLGLEENTLKKDLRLLLEELEKEKEASLKSEDQVPEMTPEEKEEALKSLKNPALTQEILEDLEKIGCVGEESGKLLGYLVTISRKLESPLSMIIVSQSSSGKSNLADVLGSVTPKEEVIHLSRITPQALYYMEKNALKGKLLIIEEKKGSEEANYPLRALQSKQSLSVAATLKDPKTGEMKTKTFGIEGSPSTLETTTDSSVHPENASRCFVNYMDESEEQTKKIHSFQRRRKSLEGILEKEALKKLKTKHQNMQRLLRPLAVVIPYAEHIHFPSKLTRTRRDNERFLNLIQVTTFLHQYQRQVKKTTEGLEYIEATQEDYQVAYKLAKDVLFDSLQEPQKLEKDFYEKLKTLSTEKSLKAFTVRTVREYTHLPDYLVRRYLDTLVRMEYLYLIEGKNGVKFEYTLNPAPMEGEEILQGLTTPEELGRILKT